MTTEKPTTLIDLISELLAETDKHKIGRLYLKIVEEVMRIEFVHDSSLPFYGLVYKHFVRLAVKNFIDSGQSGESKDVLRDVIQVLENSSIVVR